MSNNTALPRGKLLEEVEPRAIIDIGGGGSSPIIPPPPLISIYPGTTSTNGLLLGEGRCSAGHLTSGGTTPSCEHVCIGCIFTQKQYMVHHVGPDKKCTPRPLQIASSRKNTLFGASLDLLISPETEQFSYLPSSYLRSPWQQARRLISCSCKPT